MNPKKETREFRSSFKQIYRIKITGLSQSGIHLLIIIQIFFCKFHLDGLVLFHLSLLHDTKKIFKVADFEQRN